MDRKRRRPPYGTMLLVLAFISTACETAPASRATVRDSAGVQIVENAPGSVEGAPVWTLAEEPALEIGGGASPEVDLYRVSAVTPLSGGGVAIGTLTPPQVRVLDADGRLRTTLGREGDGPGEFAYVWNVVELADDSIAVWDAMRRRLNVFGPDGGFARDVDLEDEAPMSAAGAPTSGIDAGFVHLLPSADGSLVVFAEGAMSAEPAPGVQRPRLPARRLDAATGEIRAEYGAFPGFEVAPGGRMGTTPVVFGARSYGATVGRDLVVGTADTTELRVFGPDGGLHRIVRWPDRDRAVGGPWLDTWISMVEAQEPPMLREMAESAPRAERFPAYEGLVASDRGEVLVGDYAGPLGVFPLRRRDFGPDLLAPTRRTPQRRWLVFDSTGALAATLTTPEGFEPYTVRDDLVWGVHVDDLEVESVRAYPLQREGGATSR